MDEYEINIEENIHDLQADEDLVQPPAGRKPTSTGASQVASSANQTENPNKRKLTSTVWNEMVKKTVDGQEVAICNHCGSSLKAVSKNGTKHLHNHLSRCTKRKTQRDIKQCLLSMEKKQSSLAGGENSVKIGNWTLDQDVCREKLAKAIIVHEYPLSIVEHQYFREYLSSVQPLVTHVSRTTIKKEVLKIYNGEKSYLMEMIKGLKSRVAVTTDMWTSNQKKGYMTVTAHFIDNNWKLHSRILNFVYVPTPHTNENLAEGIFDSLMMWNLDRKLSTITVDNCSTNDAMITTLLTKLRKDDLILRGQILHMRCCAHILNLIVKEGVSVIEGTLERIRDSVQFWSATPSRVEKFGGACKQLDVPYNKKLCLDCKTRWNSTYEMLVTAIEYKEVFYRVQLMDRHYKCLPTENDWLMAEDICNKLSIFYEVTNLFSARKYPAANYYFGKIYKIRKALLAWKSSLDTNISLMADRMFEKFEKYWGDVHIVMAVCTVLDPRQKIKGIEFAFRAIYRENASRELQRVRDTCVELIKEYQSRQNSRRVKSTASSSSAPSGGGSGPSGSGVVASADMEDDEYEQYLMNASNDEIQIYVNSEFDHYLEDSVAPWVKSTEFDVLDWWKVNGNRYPTLQQIAKDLLAIPVSTVASESAFSTGGRIITSHRSRLNPDTIEALMCTQSWLTNETIVLKITDDEDGQQESGLEDDN